MKSLLCCPFGFFESKKLLSMNIHCSNIFIEVFLQRKRERKEEYMFILKILDRSSFLLRCCEDSVKKTRYQLFLSFLYISLSIFERLFLSISMPVLSHLLKADLPIKRINQQNENSKMKKKKNLISLFRPLMFVMFSRFISAQRITPSRP